MAQEIITWCDLCLADSHGQSRVVGHPRGPFTLGSGGPRMLDLCPTHEESLLKALEKALDEHGVAVEKGGPVKRRKDKGNEPGEYPCPACGKSYGSKNSLRTHTRAEHGQTLAEMTGAASYTCPEKSCGRGFTTIQGIAMHLSATHGWSADRRTKWIGQQEHPLVTARSSS